MEGGAPPAGCAPGAGDAGAALARAVVGQCCELLERTYLPRLQRALEELPAADLWWRPHARSTSAGQLLRHLRGNLRQWIVAGLGGAPDDRDRDAEFAPREPHAPHAAPPAVDPSVADGGLAADALRVQGGVLLGELQATLADACAVIARLDAGTLLAPVTIQGFDTNALGAVLHVTEHMSWHTGQIAWIAKLRAGEGHALAYYDDAALAARRGAGDAAGSRRTAGGGAHLQP